MKNNLLRLFFSVAVLCTCTIPASATDFVVTSLGDEDTEGTLRWAIRRVDQDNATPHTITFSVSGTITMGSQYWGLSNPVTIDGGNNIAINANGLSVFRFTDEGSTGAAGTIIKNLTIYNASNAIDNSRAANVQVLDCVIGLTAANGATANTGGTNRGISMQSANTEGFVIRGCTIAGFGSAQIFASNSRGQIDNCILGTNVNSVAYPGAGGHGIDLGSCSTIDITNCKISGNPYCGIQINACNNVVVTGTYIGTDLNGEPDTGLGNGQCGIKVINSNNVTIGPNGPNPSEDDYNIIGASGEQGVDCYDSNHITIQYTKSVSPKRVLMLVTGKSACNSFAQPMCSLIIRMFARTLSRAFVLKTDVREFRSPIRRLRTTAARAFRYKTRITTIQTIAGL